MHRFILVHGAFHGGWCWERVARLLRSHGHEVHTPTLRGMDASVVEDGNAVSVDSQIDGLVRAIKCDFGGNRGPFVLVGHSFGGFAITGAADRLDGSDVLAGLVYLDAQVPCDGECQSDFSTPAVAAERRALACSNGGAFLPPPDARVYGLKDAADIEWVNRCQRPHPFGCFDSPINLPRFAVGRGALALPRTYIDCIEPLYSDFNGLKPLLRTDSAWNYVCIRAGHDAMVSAPELLAETLEAAAEYSVSAGAK